MTWAESQQRAHNLASFQRHPPEPRRRRFKPTAEQLAVAIRALASIEQASAKKRDQA